MTLLSQIGGLNTNDFDSDGECNYNPLLFIQCKGKYSNMNEVNTRTGKIQKLKLRDTGGRK